MKVCILIPVYNEAQAIGELVRSLRNKQFEVIVVDDGSTDDSGSIAEDNGATVIRHERRHGKGFSLQRGFNYILKRDYEGVITMDGDGQHDHEDLAQFISVIKSKKADIINGNRMSNSKGMPMIRYLTNRCMSSLISWFCRQSIPDTQCGYRYVSREVLQEIFLTSGEFEIESEILMKACKNGFHVDSVPVKTIYQDEESKINPFRDTIRFFVYFIKEICSLKK